jgi:hypothetical protein
MMLAIPSILATADTTADCSIGKFKRRVCEAVIGPNGGPGACKFNGNRAGPNYGQCKNKPDFVDFPATTMTTTTTTTTTPPTVTDCSLGDRRKRQCEAILGPNGERFVCRFINNANSDRYRKCVTNGFATPPTPVTTTTQLSTTTSECYQGPIVKQKAINEFRIAFGDDVPLEQCLEGCRTLFNCAGISYRVRDLCFDASHDFEAPRC